MSDTIERRAGAWSLTFRRNAGRPTWRVTAVHDDRRRVIRQDKLTDAEVETFNPAAQWSYALLRSGITQPKEHQP